MNAPGLIICFWVGTQRHAPLAQVTNRSCADKSKVRSNVCDERSTHRSLQHHPGPGDRKCRIERYVSVACQECTENSGVGGLRSIGENGCQRDVGGWHRLTHGSTNALCVTRQILITCFLSPHAEGSAVGELLAGSEESRH